MAVTIKGNPFAVRECPAGCQCDYLTQKGGHAIVTDEAYAVSK